LFAAGVGGFDLADQRGRVVAIEAVEEDDSRLAVLPRLLDDAVEHLAGVEGTADLPAARVEEVVLLILLHRFHELFGDADGDIEVVELLLVGLAHDEIHDVRVVDPEDAHVGAAAGATLLDGFGGDVEDPHEGEGAAGDAGG